METEHILHTSKKVLTFIHKGEKLALGGNFPIRVQSMTNTKTYDFEATAKQIQALYEAGSELIRIAVPDDQSAENLRQLNDFSKVPLIADIHFDYRLAIKAMEAGFSGLRINPGNIGGLIPLKKVADCAKQHNVIIRVGVNSGSVEKELEAEYKINPPLALMKSGLNAVRLLEAQGFDAIKISIKSSSVLDTIKAYELLNPQTEYPLHIGITEAGTLFRGTVYSSVGLGILLYEGIGNTLRVSLTADPLEEVKVAYEILKSLHLRERGIEIISCPTCGRTEIDLIGLAKKVEEKYKNCLKPLKIAVMGCVVNGPGEAKEADIGIAGGKNKGIIFKKGEVIHSLPEAELFDVFIKEVDSLLAEK